MNDAMEQAAIEARRRYHKQWRQKNPEKVKAANDRYWARRAERETRAVNDPSICNKEAQGGSDAR